MDVSECFKNVRKGGKAKVCAKYSSVVTRNAFHVMEIKVGDEPSLIFVEDRLQ